jgi:hypothetical protein
VLRLYTLQTTLPASSKRDYYCNAGTTGNRHHNYNYDYNITPDRSYCSFSQFDANKNIDKN